MNINKMLDAYVECALWSSTDEEGNPLDDNYGADDIAPETLEQMREDCAGFAALIEQEGIEWAGIMSEQFGHDFWLTRNGHGAGFWDRGLGELGKQLTHWAKTFSSVDLYVGDDGLIYQ